MAGAVLNTLNTRLARGGDRLHARAREAKVLIADREFSGTVARALAALEAKPFVIDVTIPNTRRGRAHRPGGV